MNTKEMSKIRNKAKAILVEWLKTLLNEEEQKKVNIFLMFTFSCSCLFNKFFNHSTKIALALFLILLIFFVFIFLTLLI